MPDLDALVERVGILPSGLGDSYCLVLVPVRLGELDLFGNGPHLWTGFDVHGDSGGVLRPFVQVHRVAGGVVLAFLQ